MKYKIHRDVNTTCCVNIISHINIQNTVELKTIYKTTNIDTLIENINTTHGKRDRNSL